MGGYFDGSSSTSHVRGFREVRIPGLIRAAALAQSEGLCLLSLDPPALRFLGCAQCEDVGLRQRLGSPERRQTCRVPHTCLPVGKKLHYPGDWETLSAPALGL